VGQLVVRGAADDRRAQVRDRRLVEHAAERAGRQHVDLGAQRGARLEPLGAELIRQRAPVRVDVGHRQPRAGAGELPRERAPYVADADDRDAASAQARVAEAALDACAHGGLDSQRGERARVA
jgi:hypothetical protein